MRREPSVCEWNERTADLARHRVRCGRRTPQNSTLKLAECAQLALDPNTRLTPLHMARSPEPQLTRIGSYPTGGKKPANDDESSSSSSSSSSDSGDDESSSDGEKFEVERIERHRFEGMKCEFFVRWLEYPDSERSWEPEEVSGTRRSCAAPARADLFCTPRRICGRAVH